MTGGREDASSRALIRTHLLEQLAHFTEELRAFREQIQFLPAEILTDRPLAHEPSIKEIYALLAAFDESVYLPGAELLAHAVDGEIDVPDEEEMLAAESWSDFEFDAILRRAEVARTRIVRMLAEIEDWGRTIRLGGRETDVYGLAYVIIQHNTGLLRTAALRLHDLRGVSTKE